MNNRIINARRYIRSITLALEEAGLHPTEEWLTRYGTLCDGLPEAFCQLSVPREHESVFLGIIKDKLGLSESDMVDTSDVNGKDYDNFCHGYLEGTTSIWRDDDSVGVAISIPSKN